jgi:DHA1 family tetracycline resistance protein-like MFS transporter
LGGILSSSAIPTIFSYSSYISNAENRNIYLGIIGGGFGLGLIIGPFIGGILGIFNIRFVFFISFLIFLINALLVLVFLKELKIQTIEKSKSNIRLLNKYILFSLFVNFIVLFWATNMQIVLGILLSYKFHLDVFKIGLIIGIGGIFGAISQLSLKFLINLFSEKFLIVIGILLLSISMIFVPLINNPSLLFVVMVLYGLGFGISQVNITARASKKIPNEYQGQFMGLFQSSGSFGRFLGPIICSFLYQINPNLPYFLGGFILAITSMLLIIWF